MESVVRSGGVNVSMAVEAGAEKVQIPSGVRSDDGSAASAVRGLRLIVGALAVASLGLCVLVTLLAQQNRELKAELSRVSVPRAPDSLAVGKSLTPVELLARDGSPFALSFGPGQPATLVLVVSGGCPHCEKMLPFYDEVLAKVNNAKLRVVAIQTDAKKPADLEPMPATLTAYVPVEGRKSWLRDVPVVPAAFLVDKAGTITHEWLGEVLDEDRDKFMFPLIGAGAE